MSKLQQISKAIFSNPQPVRRVSPFAVSRTSNNLPVRRPQVRRIEKIETVQRAFAGAQVSNITNSWNDIHETLNGMQRASQRRLVKRSRDFSLNDPYAKKYLRMLEKNVVGPDGFTLRNKASELVYDPKKGKKVFKYDAGANKIIQESFDDWQLPENCSITGDMDFREICSLLLKTIAVDGEILVRLVRSGENKYGYSLQLIECDYLDETYNTQLNNGNIIVMGVEMTPYRKPVAYHLIKGDPYQSLLFGVGYSGDRERIPIYDERGLRQIRHLFVKEHPSQIRGIPWFAPAMIRLKMLSGYEEAILVDARLSANKHLMFTYKDASGGEEIGTANVAGAYHPKNAAGVQDKSVVISQSMPGENIIVPRGMEAAPVDFKSPSGKEGEFQRWAIRGIATGLDVSFIALANDYSQVNYTSSRTNLLEERDTWKTLHAWMRSHFLNPNFNDWLPMAIINNQVNLPLSKLDKFSKPWFQGRAWQWVSPKDEAEAILLMLSNDAGLFEEYLNENGWTLESWIEHKQYEIDLFEEAGLTFPGSNYKQVKPIEKTPEPAKAEVIISN